MEGDEALCAEELSSNSDEAEVDTAARAFWWSQLNLRRCEEERSSLLAKCETLTAQRNELRAQFLTLRGQIEKKAAARDEAMDGAVKARDCALGMLQDSEDNTRELLHFREFIQPGVADCILLGLARSTFSAWARPGEEDESQQGVGPVLRLRSWLRLLAERGDLAPEEEVATACSTTSSSSSSSPPGVPSALWICAPENPEAEPPWRKRPRRSKVTGAAPPVEESSGATIVLSVEGGGERSNEEEEPPLPLEELDTVEEMLGDLLRGAKESAQRATICEET